MENAIGKKQSPPKLFKYDFYNKIKVYGSMLVDQFSVYYITNAHQIIVHQASHVYIF